MMSYELAINEEGEPFPVPPQVWGWKVRRASERRGRPALIHDGGKPLIVRVHASHADLLAAAGPGKYRLEAVDENRRKVDGVPQAWTGPLSDDEDDEPSGDDESDRLLGGSADRRVRYEDVICQLLAQNARMVETTLGQMGTVMAGVAELLHAAHQTGITSRLPPPAPAPVPVPSVYSADDSDDGDDEDDADVIEAAPESMLPEALRLVIEKAVDKLVPLIFEKVTSGGGLGGLPLAAFLDWRKAVPNATAAPSPPAAQSTYAVPPPQTAPAAAAPPAAPSAPASAYASQVVITPAPPPAPAGVAPSPASPLGAAPAGTAPTPAPSLPVSQEDAAALLNAHILQIWQGLSAPERTRVSQLIAGLGDEQRTAWLAELARLTVPEAIARVRAVMRAQSPPTPTNPPLQTATPKGDPS